MTTQPNASATGLAGYLESMDADGTPLLGYMVLYSVFDSEVTPAQLQLWFTELGLDAAFLPGPICAVDAFEKVTGPSGIRHSYPLDDPAGSTRRRRNPQDGKGREATLMIRHVRRDKDQIVRHLVREVRDEASIRLSYDVRLAELTFRRDQAHATTLTALRELVSRFGTGSHLSRVPIPDQAEMREMIIAAFTTKSRDDLSKLAADIATATRDGATDGRSRPCTSAFATSSLQPSSTPRSSTRHSTTPRRRCSSSTPS
jgi:hypothetical protein